MCDEVKAYIVSELHKFHGVTPSSLSRSQLPGRTGSAEEGVEWDAPVVPGNGQSQDSSQVDSSLSSTLKRKTADSHRATRRQSMLRSFRKSAAALTGMRGVFSGKGSFRSPR